VTPTTVEFVPAVQPKLPPRSPDGELWPRQTRVWWAMWGRSPLAGGFGESDWAELLDTASVHARFWRGDVRVAAELRLRTANFGATPADRARLRITFAAADDADLKRKVPVDVRARYGDLHAVEAEAAG
jgi:hypothetical protein